MTEAEIKNPRYPAELATIEKLLVRMMNEERSWQEFVEISHALIRIRLHAKHMKQERDYINSDCGLAK